MTNTMKLPMKLKLLTLFFLLLPGLLAADALGADQVEVLAQMGKRALEVAATGGHNDLMLGPRAVRARPETFCIASR